MEFLVFILFICTFFFGASVSNWLWTQGLYYFYATERALSHQERKKMSSLWMFVFGIMVLLAWIIGYMAVILEYIQNNHHYWWIYSIYMTLACLVINVMGFYMLWTLQNDILLLHKNLGSLDPSVLRKIRKLWIGNTGLLTIAMIGFGLTAYQHYIDRNELLTQVDAIDPTHYEFTRRIFFVVVSLLLLSYFMWIAWIPMRTPKSEADGLNEPQLLSSNKSKDVLDDSDQLELSDPTPPNVS